MERAAEKFRRFLAFVHSSGAYGESLFIGVGGASNRRENPSRVVKTHQLLNPSACPQMESCGDWWLGQGEN